MVIYNSFDEVEFNEKTILTVGTFDGVHKGHKFILDELVKLAKAENLRSMLLTIHPHPQIVLQKSGMPPVRLLTTIDERIEQFRQTGLDSLLIIPFTYEFSLTTPTDFVVNYLVSKVGVRKILIGYDHLFGKNREGDSDLLKSLGEEHKFQTIKLDALQNHDKTISSTEIRNSLLSNKIEDANEMLGYKYSVVGTVVHGQGRARELGYPTANIKEISPNKLMPANGVYFVKSVVEGRELYGMANIGTRPTLTNDTEATLEVNFFDFDEDIYGLELKIIFINFIRNEVKFQSVNDLIEQINADKEMCKKLQDEIK